MEPAQAGERLRTLRLLLGLTQNELARLCGISQGLVSQIEAGRKAASRDVIEAVCSGTGMPRSFFSVPSVDVPEGTLRFRKYSGSRVSETHRVEELVKEGWRVFSELMAAAEYPTPKLPVINGREAFDIEELAEETRRSLGLDRLKPIGHLTRSVERHGIAVIPVVLPSLDQELGDGIGHFGVSCWPSSIEYGLIGVFAGTGDRERFTIAHELGHMVLHSSPRGSGYDAEAEAHRFAGAFLLPKDRMIESIGSTPPTLKDLAMLKARWGVSMQAIIMRGAHLGLIDDSRKTSLFKQLSARRWRTSEPVEVRREDTALPWTLLRRKFGTSPYVDAAESLGVAPMILKGWAPKVDKYSEAGRIK